VVFDHQNAHRHLLRDQVVAAVGIDRGIRRRNIADRNRIASTNGARAPGQRSICRSCATR
ncbi:MAG: hypothetical protein QOG59_1017, partial [Solirubrobacteraceae bacterium]|nr:hypothetical protein [Solirubrobacteraceae bacterium]